MTLFFIFGIIGDFSFRASSLDYSEVSSMSRVSIEFRMMFPDYSKNLRSVVPVWPILSVLLLLIFAHFLFKAVYTKKMDLVVLL